jgi:site-specific DNA recombinase
VDVGHVTNGTAGQWVSGTMMGAVSEYFRRSAKERSAEGQAAAVARGATPWARVPLGYSRRDDGTLEVDPAGAQIAQRAFAMRAAGASISQIREMLKAQGITRSHRGVQVMLSSRTYLGEIHFGQLVNDNAHDPIVEPELWERVQRMVVPRGRRADSDRLLARLGVLRCGSCGARLSAMKLPKQNDYPIYRCPSTSDCPRHVTISAEKVEGIVIGAVRTALADVEGRAAAEDSARAAAVDLDRAQAELDALIEILDPLEPAARRRLAAVTERRDEARERAERLGGAGGGVVVRGWDDRLTLDEKRALIRATVERVDVAPGRGHDRVSVHLFGE